MARKARELESAIIRGIYHADKTTIEPESLGLTYNVEESPLPRFGKEGWKAEAIEPMNQVKKAMIAAFEKDYLQRLMASHHGNVTRAAQAAGKDRRDLGRLLKKHGLDSHAFRIA